MLICWLSSHQLSDHLFIQLFSYCLNMKICGLVTATYQTLYLALSSTIQTHGKYSKPRCLLSREKLRSSPLHFFSFSFSLLYDSRVWKKKNLSWRRQAINGLDQLYSNQDIEEGGIYFSFFLYL